MDELSLGTSLPSFYDERVGGFSGSMSTIATTASCFEEIRHVAKPNVSFATTTTCINIPIALGDHPSCDAGPPIELQAGNEAARISYKPTRFSTGLFQEHKKLKPLSAQQRYDMMMELGYTKKALESAMNCVALQQKLRCESLLAALTGKQVEGTLPLKKQELIWIERIAFNGGYQGDENEDDATKTRQLPRTRSNSSVSSTSSSKSAKDLLLSGFRKLKFSNNSASVPLPAVASSGSFPAVQSELARSA